MSELRMTRARALPAVLLCCAAVPGFACTNPPLVQIPAAKDMAGQEEQVRAALERYVAAMQTYTDCIKAELEAAGGDAAPELTKTMLVRRNNLAVAEVEAVLAAFNAALGEPRPATRQRNRD